MAWSGVVRFFGKSKTKTAAVAPQGQPVPPVTPPAALRSPPIKSAAPKRRRTIPLRFWLKFFTGSVLIVSVATLLLFLSYSVRFPDPLNLAHKQHAPVIKILARDGTQIASRGTSADYMPLDFIAPHLIQAVISTEDRRFYEHWGVDPWGLLRAAWINVKAGRFAQGGSTLTQQLAKNLFLSGERKLGRKVEELTFALWLELRLTKRDILELYLNRVYFGGGAYGVEAASQRYFSKSVREVSVAEAAVLAGLLKAPSKYSPAANPQAALARSHVVLSNMVATGALSEDEASAASKNAPGFPTPLQKAIAPGLDKGLEYAVEYAIERMPQVRGSGNAEVIVETTLDARLQAVAHQSVAHHIDTYGESLHASQASVILMEPSGAIRALVGGRSYAQSQFNRAVRARRQPGSAFKPVVYLAGVESGLTPGTIGYDLPLSVKGWSPKNDNGQYKGEMTLRNALANSVNTIAVRMFLDLPKGRVIATAKRLGITSDLRDQPALALGVSEVTLLELTRAYGVLGNGGRMVTPHIIERMRMASGEVLYEHTPPHPETIVKPAHVAAMNDMLGEVMATGTGKKAALKTHPAAGKTGTTQDFRDAWFVGYTAQMTAGVWVGNDDAEPMNRVMGGSLPARIWHDLMEAAHLGEPVIPLPGRVATDTQGGGSAGVSATLPHTSVAKMSSD